MSNVEYWLVTAYYGEKAKPPKMPKMFAIQVRCHTETTRDLEIEAFNQREEIGAVNVMPIFKGAF